MNTAQSISRTWRHFLRVMTHSTSISLECWTGLARHSLQMSFRSSFREKRSNNPKWKEPCHQEICTSVLNEKVIEPDQPLRIMRIRHFISNQMHACSFTTIFQVLPVHRLSAPSIQADFFFFIIFVFPRFRFSNVNEREIIFSYLIAVELINQSIQIFERFDQQSVTRIMEFITVDIPYVILCNSIVENWEINRFSQK